MSMFKHHVEKDHRCAECSDWPYWLKIVLAYQIQTKEEIMADLSALNDAVDALVAEEGSVKAALEDLSAKVAAGNGVTQADIDAVTAKLTGVSDDLKAAVDANDPAPADNAPAPMDNGAEVAGVPDNSFPATNQDSTDVADAGNMGTEQGGGVVTDEPTVGDMGSSDNTADQNSADAGNAESA